MIFYALNAFGICLAQREMLKPEPDICWPPREVLKSEPERRGFQYLPRGPADANISEKHV